MVGAPGHDGEVDKVPQVGDEGALTVLDLAAVRRWAVVIRSAFASRRVEIDALNVFPVPDGDTGTNLYLTFDAGVERTLANEVATGAGELLADFASSLLWTARGNSGVILSQLVRGFAEGCGRAGSIDVPTLVRAIERADERAWAAVTEPIEGTILSVSRAAASAAAEASERGGDLYGVAAAVRDAAREALERTPSQLAVLARAGVVDAGGAGLLVIYEALERVCAGDDAKVLLGHGAPDAKSRFWSGQEWVAGSVALRPVDAELRVAERGDAGGAGRRDGPDEGSVSPEFEVMYLLADSDETAAATLRQRLVELGDSVLVVGGAGLWNVHAHVDDAGAAIEAGMAAGRPHRIRVTSLWGETGERHGGEAGTVRLRAGGSGVVACTAGEGIAAVFRDSGAVVVASGPGRRASTGQLIAAIREQHSTGVSGVLVLPNDGDTELAAAAAVRAVADEGIEAHLVQARTAVQGLAALAVFEPTADPARNQLAMQSASSATRHGAVTVSNREALTSGGYCRLGDILGIVDGDIVIVGADEVAVGIEVVRRLLSSGGELLTIVSGSDAGPELAAAISHAAHETAIGLEVCLIDGGQPVYSLLLGVE